MDEFSLFYQLILLKFCYDIIEKIFFMDLNVKIIVLS